MKLIALHIEKKDGIARFNEWKSERLSNDYWANSTEMFSKQIQIPLFPRISCRSGMSNWRAACSPIACLMRPEVIFYKQKLT